MAPTLSSHHQQVAYLAFCLAEELSLPYERQKNIFLAALIHDIGALTIDEKLTLIDSEPFNANDHAFQSAKLFASFAPMKDATDIVRYHHLPWNHGNGTKYRSIDVPYESHILHLADRVCANLQIRQFDITCIQDIINETSMSAPALFDPALINALRRLGKKEYIWFDLASQSPIQPILDLGLFDTLLLEIEDILTLSEIFAQIIDFRSKFTSRHSAGVAKTASAIAELSCFSSYECKMMLIAGYLHDLGKIVIPEHILEKQGPLDEREFAIIRSHPYYTYRMLQPIKGFRTILHWASYHYEKLSGDGYPFHVGQIDLPLGARIIAVADVFTALKEDRPYRKGMDDHQSKQILLQMAAERSLDENIVCSLLENFDTINTTRIHAQEEASARYEEFQHAKID